MKIEDDRQLIRIFLNRKDRYQGKQVYKVLMRQFLDMQVSGCSVYRSLAGYGNNFILRKARGPAFLKNKGIVIQVVETKRKIEEILKLVEKVIPNGLVTISDVRMIRYSRNEPNAEDLKLAEKDSGSSLGNLNLD